MPLYDYKALESKGKKKIKIRGTMDAPNPEFVKERLLEQNLVLIELKPSKKKSVAEGNSKKKAGEITLGAAKIAAKDLTVVTRQLAILLQAGLPLIRALRTLERQAKNPGTRKALGKTAEAIEGGATFSEALAQSPKSFDSLYRNMVKAGEASGALEIILDRLATFREKSARIIKKIKSAMVYPVVVMVIALGITTFLLLKIVPSFKDMFASLLAGEPLPEFTQFVIDFSDFLKSQILFVVIVLATLIVGFILTNRTKPGRRVIDWVKFNMPVFGAIVSKNSVSKFCSTLGTLLSSGVPVLGSLVIVRDTSDNQVIIEAVQKIHDAVKEGDGIAIPLNQTKVFPAMVVSMVEVGEETGKLPEMLEQIAEVYEEEVDNAVGALTSLIEPALMMFLAVVVGGIVIAMFMPMIKIIEKLSAG